MEGHGTGYGGRPDDNKKLVAGRKKAQKAEAKDDKASIRFLKVSLVLLHVVYSYNVFVHILIICINYVIMITANSKTARISEKDCIKGW